LLEEKDLFCSGGRFSRTMDTASIVHAVILRLRPLVPPITVLAAHGAMAAPCPTACVNWSRAPPRKTSITPCWIRQP